MRQDGPPGRSNGGGGGGPGIASRLGVSSSEPASARAAAFPRGVLWCPRLRAGQTARQITPPQMKQTDER